MHSFIRKNLWVRQVTHARLHVMCTCVIPDFCHNVKRMPRDSDCLFPTKPQEDYRFTMDDHDWAAPLGLGDGYFDQSEYSIYT